MRAGHLNFLAPGRRKKISNKKEESPPRHGNLELFSSNGFVVTLRQSRLIFLFLQQPRDPVMAASHLGQKNPS